MSDLDHCQRCGCYFPKQSIFQQHMCPRCKDEVEAKKQREREQESREAEKRLREVAHLQPKLPSEIYAEKLAAGEISLPNSLDSSSSSSTTSGSSGLFSMLLKLGGLGGIVGCVLLSIPVLIFFGLFAFGCLLALAGDPAR